MLISSFGNRKKILLIVVILFAIAGCAYDTDSSLKDDTYDSCANTDIDRDEISEKGSKADGRSETANEPNKNTKEKGQTLFPRAAQFRGEDLTYDDGNTIYYKTYYDDFVRGKTMQIDYHIDVDIREEPEDYFLSEQAGEYELFESLTEMFYDYRTVEMPEEDLIELFYRHGYELCLHSAKAGEMHIRFVEIIDRDGLSLYPARILRQSWYGYYLYLQNITGPIPRKIRSFLVVDNMDGLRLVVHSSGLSRDFIAEEELSFWEDRGTYWILSPMELEIDTSHAHIAGDSFPDLNRDALFEPSYYKDGIAYRPSRQSDGVNCYTFRPGKMEEVEKNKIFRLEAVTEVEGRLSILLR